MKKLSIICKHLQENPKLSYEVVKDKPADKRDSGYVLFCKKYAHNFANADGWVTSHLDHFGFEI